jgi:hypothetical protein
MLKIRPQHVTALAAQQADGFTRRMMIHLREIFSEEVAALDDAALKAFVEKVCAQAEEWDVTDEPQVERLIELFASFESIRRNPVPDWISRMVRDPNRSADRLTSELEDELRFGDHS